MTALLSDERPVEAHHRAAQPRPSDEELLQWFVVDRSDLAFAQLVASYGAFVMTVCRRVLGKEQDAEDAFQATFLVLARKAASLRRTQSLPAWLHKTAYRIALRARSAIARRREQPLEVEPMIAAEALSEIASDYDLSALDKELTRLPDAYRVPLYLCCIEGLSRNEAARRLGWSLGSLKGRLERGRDMLRRRLMLRGVSLGGALALLIRTHQAAHAAVAPPLVASTVQAGVQYAAGQSVVGFVSPNTLSLANGSIRIMSLTTSKVVLCSLVIIGMLAWGTGKLPAPAAAGGEEIKVQVLAPQADAASSVAPEVPVALLAADEGRRRRRPSEAEPEAKSQAPAELPGRYVHVALYTLKPDAPKGTAAMFAADAQKCFRQIPEIRGFQVGSPAGQATPKAWMVEPTGTYHVGVVLCFDAFEGMAKYGNHPRHNELKQKYAKFFDKIVAYDFEGWPQRGGGDQVAP